MSDPQPEQEGVAGLRGRRTKAANRARRTPPAPLHPRSDPGDGGTAHLSSSAPTPAVEPPPAEPDRAPAARTGGGAGSVPDTVEDTDPALAAAPGAALPAEVRSAPATRAPAGADVVSAGIPAAPAAGTAPREITREISREVSREVLRPVASESAGAMPDLWVDMTSALARMPKPTMMNVPTSIMARFSRARRDASSHTGVVLDALRDTVTKLPELVAEARPQPRAGDLFPLRGSGQRERRDPLRVRPTVAEVAVIDRIVEWVGEQIEARYPGSPPVTRSEVVSAALDAYLPGRRSRTIAGS